jgi:hypothetical protein
MIFADFFGGEWLAVVGMDANEGRTWNADYTDCADFFRGLLLDESDLSDFLWN